MEGLVIVMDPVGMDRSTLNYYTTYILLLRISFPPSPTGDSVIGCEALYHRSSEVGQRSDSDEHT